MTERIETEAIIWSGITIEVKLTSNWLNGIAHHLELRAGEPLSVTATGYRSHFIPAGVELNFNDVIAFVTSWLEEEAQSRSWQKHVEQTRQGDLFDI